MPFFSSFHPPIEIEKVPEINGECCLNMVLVKLPVYSNFETTKFYFCRAEERFKNKETI